MKTLSEIAEELFGVEDMDLISDTISAALPTVVVDLTVRRTAHGHLDWTLEQYDDDGTLTSATAGICAEDDLAQIARELPAS